MRSSFSPIVKAVAKRLGYEVRRLPRSTNSANKPGFNLEISGTSGVGKSTLAKAFCETSTLGFTHINSTDSQLSSAAFLANARPWHYRYLRALIEINEQVERPDLERLKFTRWAVRCIEIDIKYNQIESAGGYLIESGVLLFGLWALLKLDDHLLREAFSQRHPVFLLSNDPEFVLRNIRKREKETGRLSSNHHSKTDREICEFLDERFKQFFSGVESLSERSDAYTLVLLAENGLKKNLQEMTDFCSTITEKSK